MSGVGERAADIAASIEAMRAMDADQVRVMTFVPQAGTPMAGLPAPDNRRELLTIAVMRLAFPDRPLPIELVDVERIEPRSVRIAGRIRNSGARPDRAPFSKPENEEDLLP